MPTLEQHPSYKYAAQLAKVGPETWNSWIGALAAVASGFQELTKDAPMGTVLRQLGAGKERTKLEPDKQLEQMVLDYMVPQASGVIKGLKAGIRKGKPEALKLREVMKEEFSKRGPVPKEPPAESMIDDLLQKMSVSDYYTTVQDLGGSTLKAFRQLRAPYDPKNTQQNNYELAKQTLKNIPTLGRVLRELPDYLRPEAISSTSWLGKLLRGTPYHGSRYERIPQLGEVFNIENFKSGNLGEPIGMSLTYKPDYLFGQKGQFAKHPQKMDRVQQKLTDTIDRLKDEYVQKAKSLPAIDDPAYEQANNELRPLIDKVNRLTQQLHRTDPSNSNLPFARVFPRFHGQPEDVIVKAWKGGGDEELLKEAYSYAVQQTPEVWGQRFNFTTDILQDIPGAVPQHAAKVLNKISTKPEDLQRLSEMLYVVPSNNKALVNTHIENTKDIVATLPTRYKIAIENLQQGKVTDDDIKVVQSLSNIISRAQDIIHSGTLKPSAAGPDYARIRYMLPNGSEKRKQFNENITQYLQSKGKRGVLYLPQRYDEYELRIFDPRDVVMLDMRKVSDKQWDKVFGGTKGKIQAHPLEPTTRSKTIDNWEQEGSRQGLSTAHSETSLGKIYKDIDLPNLQPWSDEVRRSTAEQVKTSVLAQAMETEKAGLRVGKPGYERGVRRGTDIPYAKDQDLDISDWHELATDNFDWEAAHKELDAIMEPGAPGVDPLGMKPLIGAPDIPQQDTYFNQLKSKFKAQLAEADANKKHLNILKQLEDTLTKAGSIKVKSQPKPKIPL